MTSTTSEANSPRSAKASQSKEQRDTVPHLERKD